MYSLTGPIQCPGYGRPAHGTSDTLRRAQGMNGVVSDPICDTCTQSFFALEPFDPAEHAAIVRSINRDRALKDFDEFLDLLSDDPRIQKLQELWDEA